MTDRRIEVGEIVRSSWKTAWAHRGLWFLVMLVIAVIQYGPSLAGKRIEHIPLIPLLIVSVILIALSLTVQIGAMNIALKLVRGQSAVFNDLFAVSGVIVSYFFASVLYGLCALVGFLLLIVPGIIVSLRLSLYSYYILDQHKGPIEALKASWNATKGSTWDLFFWGIVSAIINGIGMIPFGLGLFITMPMTLVGSAVIYEKLSRSPEEIASAVPVTV